MAHVIPAEPIGDESAAERKVRRALSDLSKGWRVLHHVRWQRMRKGRPADGEADFVLLHPAVGMLVVEVKGGRIDIEDGAWYSTDRHDDRHSIKDPFLQATESKHALAGYLKERLDLWLPVGHAVALPDVEIAGDLGPSAPRALVWDREDFFDPEAAVRASCEHWELEGPLRKDDIDRVVAQLAPTVSVRPLLRGALDAAEVELLRLTEQQTSTLDLLRSRRRALIRGAAGTGKSVLAAARARRLADEGARVLLTCFNRPLGEYLAEQFAGDDRVIARHFHNLCVWQAASAGHELIKDPPQEWWDEELPDLLVKSAETNEFSVDAIVVDEGQDFLPDWWTYLELLLVEPEHGPFYVFADTHQEIYRQDWVPPFDDEPFTLDINCRNTLPIARCVSLVFGDDEIPTLGVEGPPPQYRPATSPEEVERQVGAAVHELVHEEGVETDDIVILTSTKARSIALRGKKMGGRVLVSYGGQGIPVETIHRFKGLESDVAIVVLEDLEDEHDLDIAYVGLSRAKTYLVVVGMPSVATTLGLS